jgi:ankyrin repeat protein
MNTLQSVRARTYAFILMLGLSLPGYAALVDMAEYQDWDGVLASISTDDINALQPDGTSALLWAVYYEETDMVSLLLDAGADANAQNRYGLTPLIQSSIYGNGEIISLLLDAGADANAGTLLGDTALMNAAKAGTIQGVQALIAAGANVEARDDQLSQTPLMWAAVFDHADIVRILADNGADINAKSLELIFPGVIQGPISGDFPDGGLTSLHHAARDNAVETVGVLLALGADPNILDPQDISPLRVAITMGLEHKRDRVGHAASNYDNQTTAEELIALMMEMGVDVDSMPREPIPLYSTSFIGGAGNSGQTALYNAALVGRIDDMEMLLTNGANPNFVSTAGDSSTPLGAVLGVWNGYRIVIAGNNSGAPKEATPTSEDKAAMLDLLFDYGADVNTITGKGDTILHQAASLGKDKVIEYLLAKGIDLSIKDDSNRTALDIASGVPEFGAAPRRAFGATLEELQTPIYESSMAILTEAMNAQGVAIEEYVEPVTEEAEELREV